ncbi:unnamed protein product [Cuscuta campestris]|uniref:Uncharacterized protein n=1 Tax=Cuscuta campestris TaxID=132261 RepID=A0A484K1Q9_9ASTE|nr:unnamed protein product [Cuscuta campestris]
MGFKFQIEYETGVSNKAANALSRSDIDEDATSSFAALSQPIPVLIDAVITKQRTRPNVSAFKASVEARTALSGALSMTGCYITNGGSTLARIPTSMSSF